MSLAALGAFVFLETEEFKQQHKQHYPQYDPCYKAHPETTHHPTTLSSHHVTDLGDGGMGESTHVLSLSITPPPVPTEPTGKSLQGNHLDALGGAPAGPASGVSAFPGEHPLPSSYIVNAMTA